MGDKDQDVGGPGHRYRTGTWGTGPEQEHGGTGTQEKMRTRAWRHMDQDAGGSGAAQVCWDQDMGAQGRDTDTEERGRDVWGLGPGCWDQGKWMEGLGQAQRGSGHGGDRDMEDWDRGEEGKRDVGGS